MRGDPAALSRLSTERFGIPIAHLDLEPGDDLPAVLGRLRSAGPAMAVIRLDVSDLTSAQRLEVAGARLCDTLVYWARSLPVDFQVSDRIRRAGQGDADTIAGIARSAFAGYVGHFQADPRLDRTAADEIYVDWARRSCDGSADRVWLVDDDGPAGFLSLRFNGPDESEILLNAVRPERQRRGLYRLLVVCALVESSRSGARRCIVSTQLHNQSVQRVWAGMGFEPSAAIHTFHLWLD